MDNLLEARLNNLNDEELVDELAAAHEEMRHTKEAEKADSAVQEAKLEYDTARAPFAEKISYMKRYVKVLNSICKMREIHLKIKPTTEELE